MWKIILHRVYALFSNKQHKESQVEHIDRLYSKSIILLTRPTTLSQLYLAKKMIHQHKQEVEKYNSLPWMIVQQDKLNILWAQKFKLWKTRD